MSPSVPNPTQASERPTLGRLSGLTAGEADRGERALWLTGDGRRSALFHLGALTRLNELGLLAGLERIGAASGGSIVAALLATRVPWPLAGSCTDWEQRVAAPLRELEAGIEQRPGVQRRRPFPGLAGEAALEEHYARELLGSWEVAGRGPRFVFGAPGLALSGIGAGEKQHLEWDIAAVAPGGYERELVAGQIAALHTGLGGFDEPAQAVLENHGYLLADAAAQEAEIVAPSGAGAWQPSRIPHPDWMDAERAREALATATSGRRIRRLHLRRRGGEAEHPTPPRAG